MAIEKTIYINVEGAEAINEIDDINEGLEETTDITDEIGEQALAAAGNFKIMGVSVNQVIGTLKKLKITLISTGIGAIAVAVGTLAAAFLSTQEGANLVTKVMEPLSEVMNTIWGILQEMGSAMAKILSGDFVGGWEEMGRAVEDMGLKMKIAVGRGNEMADLQIRLAKTEASYIKTLSDLNLQRERYRASVDDEDTLSLEERRKALINLEAVNNAIYELQKGRQEDELKLLKQKTEANDTDYAAKVEIARKEAELNEAAGQREKQRKEEFLIGRRLRGADTGDINDIVSPITGISTNELQEISTTQAQMMDDAMLAAFERRQKDYDDAAHQKSIQDQILEEQEHTKNQVLLNAGYMLADGLMMLGEKNKAFMIAGLIAEQAATSATAILNMIVANSKMIALFPATGGQPWVGINTATTIAGIAMGAAATGVAISKLGGGGSASAPSIGGLGGSSPAPSFNVVGASQSSSLEQTLLSQGVRVSQDTPIKSYVVASDVTTMQSLDRQVEANAGV